MLSYATSWGFLLTDKTPTPGQTGETRVSSTLTTYPQPKVGYVPMITKVGKTSEKIFVADAGKFATATGAPDFNVSSPHAYTSSTYGCIGTFSDYGPWTKMTCGFDRTVANGGTGLDCRVFTYRHGKTVPN